MTRSFVVTTGTLSLGFDLLDVDASVDAVVVGTLEVFSFSFESSGLFDVVDVAGVFSDFIFVSWSVLLTSASLSST